MLHRKFVKIIKTHFTFNNFCFWKSCRVWDEVEKYDTDRQATYGRMARAHCMQITWGWKHKHRL